MAYVEFLGFQPLAGVHADWMMPDDEILPLDEPDTDLIWLRWVCNHNQIIYILY